MKLFSRGNDNSRKAVLKDIRKFMLFCKKYDIPLEEVRIGEVSVYVCTSEHIEESDELVARMEPIEELPILQNTYLSEAPTDIKHVVPQEVCKFVVNDFYSSYKHKNECKVCNKPKNIVKEQLMQMTEE